MAKTLTGNEPNPSIFPNRLYSMYTEDLFFLGVIEPPRIKFEIQLNKDLAEYLYNVLGKFLGKTS